MDAVEALITFGIGLGGVALGALLARRNETRAQADRLLVEALNDVVQAIAEVAGGGGKEAQARYASAVSRIALHGPPRVVTAFRCFQDDATTASTEGRARLLAAIQTARSELGCAEIRDEGDLATLLFGPGQGSSAGE